MGDTDPLADLLHQADREAAGPDGCKVTEVWGWYADALRAALADGTLDWRAVVPPEVAAVYAAAVAWGTGGDEWAHLEALGEAAAALPEHLRGER